MLVIDRTTAHVVNPTWQDGLQVALKLWACAVLLVIFYLRRPRGPCQVKECKIILEQSLLTGWLAIGFVNLGSNFIKPTRVEPWNEVETSGHERSDGHEGKTVCLSNRRVRVSVKVLKVLVQES